jgi:hypothetical protein
MRDPLHVRSARQVLGLAIVSAVLAAALPSIAVGKVLLPEAAERMPDRGAADKVGTAPTPVVPTATEAAVQPTVATTPPKPVTTGKAPVDPNAPEPLTERAQAALDRAKAALAAEEQGDFYPDPQTAAGQPVDSRKKTAAAPTKPVVKCVAGC